MSMVAEGMWVGEVFLPDNSRPHQNCFLVARYGRVRDVVDRPKPPRL